MVDAPSSPAAPADGPFDAEGLRACMRDLLELLALPALWRERDKQGVLQGLFDALETALPISFGCARVHESVHGDHSVDFCRVDGKRIEIDDPVWRELIEACEESGSVDHVA